METDAPEIAGRQRAGVTLTVEEASFLAGYLRAGVLGDAPITRKLESAIFGRPDEPAGELDELDDDDELDRIDELDELDDGAGYGRHG